MKIGDNVKIAAQSGVGNNLPDNAIVQGSPAFEVGNYRRSYVSFRRLPETLKAIETKLKSLNEFETQNDRRRMWREWSRVAHRCKCQSHFQAV